MATSGEDVTTEIINDARDIQDSSKREGYLPHRNDTLFYKVVIGGNVQHISKVLDALKSNESNKALFNWLVKGQYSHTAVETEAKKNMRTIKYIFLIPLWIILTPIFYPLHSFVNAILNRYKSRQNLSLSRLDVVDFPLAFAVLSADEDMLKLFLDLGIKIDLADYEGCNILHYLADLSGYDLEKALKCLSIVTGLVGSKYLSKATLINMTQQVDQEHLQNPIEYACQYGNLQFATKLISQTMTSTSIQVSKDRLVTVKSKESKKSLDTDTTKDARDKGWTEMSMDITPYSTSTRNGLVSYLLHLIIERKATEISAESWYYIRNNASMQKWMSLKLDQWIFFILVNVTLELGITILLIVIMLFNSQGDINLTPNKQIFTKAHIEVFLSKWQTISPETDTAYYNLSVDFFSQYSDLESELSSGNKEMDYVEMLGLIRALPNFTDFDNMTGLYDHICTEGNYTLVGDLVEMDNCTKQASDNILNLCEEDDAKYGYYFTDESLSNYEFVIATSFLTPIYNDSRSVFRNLLRTDTGSSSQAILYSLIAYFLIYMILDLIHRVIVLVVQIYSDNTYFSIFATPIQGSSLKGAVNILCAFSFLVILFYYYNTIVQFYSLSKEFTNLADDILSYDRSNDRSITSNFALATFLVIMVVCRIILLLHFMKFIPWIGNFVVTTFQMAADLLKFSFVYCLMVFFFSIVFHVLSRDLSCPYFRNEENYSIWLSFFSTFALTFGHVDMPYDNFAVKVTYVVYVILSIILLLNLIIAVMSSTASAITVEPWASQLYTENLLKEALGIESWVYFLFPSLDFTLKSFWTGYNVNFDKHKDIRVSVKTFTESKHQVL